jgi:hypothetical protein
MALRPGRQLEQLSRFGGFAGRRVRRALSEPTRWVLLSTLDATLSGLDAALNSPLAQEAVGRILASPLTDDVWERIVGGVLESPDAERVLARVIDSRMVESVMLQLLESDGLWILVEEIAQSPAVTAAISQQGVGFANQMAGVMRDRSRTADDRLERLVRRLARRRPRVVSPASDEPAGDEPASDEPASDGPASDEPASGS